MKPKTIQEFNESQSEEDRRICDRLRREINLHLPEAESKIWHAHPVWFLDGNPTVGYSKLKDCIRLMFWSGADFDEPKLCPGTGKFKDASARYTQADEINAKDLKRWLGKAKTIQWDYRNIQKRQGKLLRISRSAGSNE
ncbi:MAG: DUF1801 domain-containing protein [Pseudomonadales bacterium]